MTHKEFRRFALALTGVVESAHMGHPDFRVNKPERVREVFGENRGLEGLRRMIASRSRVHRVDIPVPYEPDQDIVPFEEADVFTRAKVSLAASWLFAGWPARFIECCQEAAIQYPALNRNAIATAYMPSRSAADRKFPTSQGDAGMRSKGAD